MSGQMARFERAKERDRIRCEVDASVNHRYSDDPLAAQWALVAMAHEGVLAICNLAETLEAANEELTDNLGLMGARAMGIRDAVRDLDPGE